MSGTLHLLYLGAERQQGEKQTRWLSLAASLMDASIHIENNTEHKKHTPIFKTSKTTLGMRESELFTFHKQIGETNTTLAVDIESFSEQVISATAFLLLNELGRNPPDKRQQVFDNLQQHFLFQISRTRIEDLILDSRQLERLSRGETITEWDKQFGRSLAVNVYAPWGKTSDVLTMGPIEFFDPYPTDIVVSFFFIALLLIALSVMIIIKHLSNRLLKLQDKVDAISPNYLAVDEHTEKPDAIAQLHLKIQDMAARIEKLLSEKAYMIRAVSHDLRTPIAKMHFRLDSLAVKLGDNDQTLQGCGNDLKQLNLLIDELLTYEKFSVKQNIKFEPVDINLIAEQQSQSIAVMFPHLSIHVDTSITPDFVFQGNEILLCRLLENLLNNAGRYANNQINILLSNTEDQLEIIIEDDGIGLEQDMIPKLFDPFFQADRSRTAHREGYGLGLAIVKQVVMQHNGIVAAKNNALGGASFICLFPLSSENSTAHVLSAKENT